MPNNASSQLMRAINEAKYGERVLGQRGCDWFGDRRDAAKSLNANPIEPNGQCGTPKCEYPPKRTRAWTIAVANRCLDREEKYQLESRAAL